MTYRLNPSLPAGLITPGDRLLVAEGVALEVTAVRPAELRPSMVTLVLEDGRELTYPDVLPLAVKVWWED